METNSQNIDPQCCWTSLSITDTPQWSAHWTCPPRTRWQRGFPRRKQVWSPLFISDDLVWCSLWTSLDFMDQCYMFRGMGCCGERYWSLISWNHVHLFFTFQGHSGAYRTDLAADLTPTSASRVTVVIKMKVGDAQIVESFKQVLYSHLMCGLCKGSIVSQGGMGFWMVLPLGCPSRSCTQSSPFIALCVCKLFSWKNLVCLFFHSRQ